LQPVGSAFQALPPPRIKRGGGGVQFGLNL
jgi:hypothetical protein